jgi:hypothetical protein
MMQTKSGILYHSDYSDNYILSVKNGDKVGFIGTSRPHLKALSQHATYKEMLIFNQNPFRELSYFCHPADPQGTKNIITKLGYVLPDTIREIPEDVSEYFPESGKSVRGRPTVDAVLNKNKSIIILPLLFAEMHTF